MVCLAYYIRKDTLLMMMPLESLRFWTSSFTSEMFMFFPLCVHQMLFTSQKGSLAICSIWAFSVFLQCESSRRKSSFHFYFPSFFVLLLKEGSGRIFAILMSITLPFFLDSQVAICHWCTRKQGMPRIYQKVGDEPYDVWQRLSRRLLVEMVSIEHKSQKWE